MKKRNINKQHKNINIVKEMKSINKKLMKAKLKNYKKYKEKNKEHELDLNNQANQIQINHLTSKVLRISKIKR